MIIVAYIVVFIIFCRCCQESLLQKKEVTVDDLPCLNKGFNQSGAKHDTSSSSISSFYPLILLTCLIVRARETYLVPRM